ncbi:MAG: DUF3617 domain-containing protein [Thermoanaerobaculia bacterium]
MKRVMYAIAIASLVPMVASAGPMKPGKWQMSTETEMDGAPSARPQVLVRCVTPEEAEKLEPPRSVKKDADCKVGDYNVNGRVMTWSIKCSKQNISGGGKIMYNDDTYSGQVKLKLGKADMTQTFNGKLLGDCDTKAQEQPAKQ